MTQTDLTASGRPPVSVAQPTLAGRITLPKLVTIAAVIAMIYVAKDVVLPLSIAMLVTFALSPLVTKLRRFGIPHLGSVLAVVAIAFAAVSLFLLVVVAQIGTLAQNLPTFQSNIIAKVENIRKAGNESGLVSRFTDMVTAINAEVGAAAPVSSQAKSSTAQPSGAPASSPMPVQLVENRGPFALLRDLVLPLISPIATVGLVVVVVIFMLLEREELRDRFIKLVGTNDIHRTTQMMEEAGQRVAQYLLMQVVINVMYAAPIGIGLWLIGVPNAVLWGLLTLVLRFVPYIGTLLAAAFPLFLAFAIVPGWSAVLWTVSLFAVVEFITSNVVEPKLYGSRTGVSPLAIIVSAIFWAWLWGPLGLVLSTPLTVCLVVLGRHIPQFAMFEILFGDEPVLAPYAKLYQRLLVGDVLDATAQAEEALETLYLADYYRDIGIPALLSVQTDWARGALLDAQMQRLAETAQAMVSELSETVNEEIAEAHSASSDLPTDDNSAPKLPLPGEGFRIVCVGGRSALDDVSAAMLAESMMAKGANASYRPHTDLAASRFTALAADQQDCVVLCFLDPSPSRGSFLQVRRIKLASPNLRVGLVVWRALLDPNASQDPATINAIASADKRLQDMRDLAADFAVTSFDQVLLAAFSNDAPTPVAAFRKSRRQSAGSHRSVSPTNAPPSDAEMTA